MVHLSTVDLLCAVQPLNSWKDDTNRTSVTSSSALAWTHLVDAVFVYFSLCMFSNLLKYVINVKILHFCFPNSLKNQICVQWDVGGRGTTTKTNCWIDVRQAVVSLPCFSLPLLRLSVFVFWFSRVFQTEEEKKTFSLHHCIYSLTSCSAWFVDLWHSTTALHCLSFSFILTTDCLRVFQWIRYMAAF